MDTAAANSNRIAAFFRTDSKKNEVKSAKEGRPIFDDVELCEIRIAGNRQTVGVYPAHAFSHNEQNPDGTVEPYTYAQRFAPQYRRFKEKRLQVKEGTPLDELPFLPESKRSELKALSIHTAEALAALDGPELKNLGMGGREWKEQALAYLDKAKGSASTTKQAKEIAALKEQIAALQAQVGEQAVPKSAGVTPELGDDDGTSTFDGFTVEELKDWIERKAGTRPKGQPNKATLLAMAKELDAAPAVDPED